MTRRIKLLYRSLFSSHTDPNNTTFYFLYRLYCDPHQIAMNERLQAHFMAPCNNIYIDEDPIRTSWKIVRIRNWILSTKKDISTTTLNLTPSPPGFANIFYNKLILTRLKSALRADETQHTRGLVLTPWTSPTHWTRPQRLPSRSHLLQSDYQLGCKDWE